MCDKAYTEKRNLTRHQKTSHHSYQTHPEDGKLPKEDDENEINIEDYLWSKNQELIRIIKKEWKNIRTNYRRNEIINIYNFRIQNNEKIKKLLWGVFFDHKGPFKINLNFSFILRNKLTGDLRFWDNQESVGIFEKPKMIASLSDFENFLSDFSMIDYVQKLFEQCPDTKWIFYQILSLNVFTYKIYDGKSLLKI